MGMVKKIQAWMNVCTDNHDQCARARISSSHQDEDFVPSRLIKIGMDLTSVTQLTSLTTPVRYAALSYCWGSTNQLVTTTSNVSARYQQLHSANLPQTLQDAIFMTKALGLEYLWIDSICIVQDDKDDWAREASRMGDIYACAWIVLAATAASDCAEGFLHHRKEKLTLGSHELGPKALTIHARQINNHGPLSQTVMQHYPLFQRGWCMQERQLARRIVHSLPDEVHFTCQTKYYCECSLTPVGQWRNEFRLSPFRTLMLAQDTDGTTGTGFGIQWGQIVQEYSRLSLTHPSDTLPALSGLAQRMTHFNPKTYIAGLWERDIAYLLGWRRDIDMTKPQRSSGALAEPTFSWTASSGPVTYREKIIGPQCVDIYRLNAHTALLTLTGM
jgi:hypothetical protein